MCMHVWTVFISTKSLLSTENWQSERKNKEEWWEKYEDKRGERENPLLFFQSGGVVLLTGWFILSPLLHVPISNPPISDHHLHPTLHFFHSFFLPVFFLWAACEHSYLEMQALLLKWLTCTAVRFSCDGKILTAHFSLWINAAASDEAERGRDTEHLLFIKDALSDVWPLWPTLISVWQCSLHTSKDHSPLRMNNESESQVKTKYILSS